MNIGIKHWTVICCIYFFKKQSLSLINNEGYIYTCTCIILITVHMLKDGVAAGGQDCVLECA